MTTGVTRRLTAGRVEPDENRTCGALRRRRTHFSREDEPLSPAVKGFDWRRAWRRCITHFLSTLASFSGLLVGVRLWGRRSSPPRLVKLFGFQLENRDRHVNEVMIPDDDQIAAANVVTMAKKVGCLEFSLSKDAAAAGAENVVGKGYAAFQDAVAEARRPLREHLPDVHLVLRDEGNAVAVGRFGPIR